jgi:glutamyl-tRNA reductase
MGLVVVGLSHHTAPLEVRERVALAPADIVSELTALRREGLALQAMLLSTCNRTEVYALAAEDEPALLRLRQGLFAPRLRDAGAIDELLYQHVGHAAAAHLYRVAAGLDSMLIGETQILGQVKTAHELARQANTAGALLHRLVDTAVHVGKRAHAETAISAGAVSTASVAVELAEKVFQRLVGRRALLVGAGENGRLCAQHLLARQIDSLLIANRTQSRAEALAAELGGEVVSFDELEAALARVDVVVSTTGSPDPVITLPMVQRAMRERAQQPLVLLDMAVPRDIESEVDKQAEVFRFDLDALESAAAQNFERRKKEIPAVERLIELELAGFTQWWASLEADPVLRDLHAAFESVRDGEVQKNAKRFCEADQRQLQLFSKSLVQKLLMQVTHEIKQYQGTNPLERERLAVLRQLFHLEAPPEAPETSATDKTSESSDEDEAA